MLKIKDNVDLKELEKFGLKPKYDENTGEVVMLAYYKYISLSLFNLNQMLTELNFVKNKNNDFILDNKHIIDEDLVYELNADLLYDLIKADLVEKVVKNK